MVVDRASDSTPILIRSPQPDEDDIRHLHNLYGLTTVINLRGADVPGYGFSAEHSDEAPSWWIEEKEICEKLGIDFWTMNLGDGTAPPSSIDIDIFFRLIQDPAAWPVLVHCQAGIHRAGSMVALYRIQFQEWSAQRAIEEMESYGYDWSISDRSAVKDFLRFYRQDPDVALPR